METKTSFKRYLLICSLGFGLSGLLWGFVLYNALPELEFPFHFMAILIMGLIGGIFLVFDSKSIKEYSKSVVAGFLGWGVGFITSIIVVYPFYLYGVLILTPLGYFIEINTLDSLLNLQKNIGVGDFWLVFMYIGAMVGLFYSLFLKIKIWALIWRSAVGLGLGSIIGPIVGNLTGNLFNSLLISYLITFLVIGLFSGLFLSWGIYKHKR